MGEALADEALRPVDALVCAGGHLLDVCTGLAPGLLEYLLGCLQLGVGRGFEVGDGRRCDGRDGTVGVGSNVLDAATNDLRLAGCVEPAVGDVVLQQADDVRVQGRVVPVEKDCAVAQGLAVAVADEGEHRGH